LKPKGRNAAKFRPHPAAGQVTVGSEPESFSSVAEQRAKTHLI
jgi:hypothetical protein